MVNNRGFGGRAQNDAREGDTQDSASLGAQGGRVEERLGPSRKEELLAQRSSVSPVSPASLRPAPGVVVKETGKQRTSPLRRRGRSHSLAPAAGVNPSSPSFPRPPTRLRPLRSSTCPAPGLSKATRRGLATRPG